MSFECGRDMFPEWLVSPDFNIALGPLVELCMKNARSEGIPRWVREKLLSIKTTEAIVGRFATFSWTQWHNSPMWMHLIISILEPPRSVESMTFVVVIAFQFFHAYKKVTTIFFFLIK